MALGVLAVISAVAAALTIGVAGARGVPAQAAAGTLDASVSGPDAAVTYQVSDAAQRQAVAHWTTPQMQGATSAAPARGLARISFPGVTRTQAQPGVDQAAADVTAPRGTPTAAPFPGSPTTGVLFYTTGGKGHFCTASVVDSSVDDLALTAAHCVYAKGFASNIEYVPGYHDGKRPYGAWPVRSITVASGWKASHDPDLDFAFLSLAAVGGQQIQARTGGLTIGFTRWYSEKIEAIGHNDTDAEPIRCATRSFRFRTGQMEFYCHGFWTGTSGGPWIIGYNAKTGTGTVFGVIGGYELGGDYEWASYSAYFGSAARLLYDQAERQGAPRPTPSPTATAPPTGIPTASNSPTASPTTTNPPASTATASPTSPDTVYPTAPPSTSAAAPSPSATPSPTSPISTAYQPPVIPG